MSRGVRKVVGYGVALGLLAGLGVSMVFVYRQAGNGMPKPGSPTYEEMVAAFSSGVAALDTDANTIARDSLERATKTVPLEPAAWADLGLAQIRLGDFEKARISLDKAMVLAPENGPIQALMALLEQRRGRFSEAIAHLKLAIQYDPKDLRSRYALAKEMEREGGDVAGAFKMLGSILEVAPKNLEALFDRAQLATKLNDKQAIAEVVERLRPLLANWPANSRTLFAELETAAAKNPKAVTIPLLRLRNTLVRFDDYQQSITALSLPTGTVGAPLHQFLRLQVPAATPAPPDETLTFALESLSEEPKKVGAIALLPNPQDGTSVVLEADGKELRKADGSGVIAPFPGGASAAAPSPHGVAVVDWNSDYRLDLVLAGSGGLRIFRQKEDGAFEDVTTASKLPPEVLNADLFGVWAADIELDGDLDFILGLRAGATVVVRNRGDGSFEPTQPFASVANLREFAWADLDHDGDPDAAFLDNSGKLIVLENSRAGRFRNRPAPDGLASQGALAVADLNGDGVMDLMLVDAQAIRRLSDRDHGEGWELAEVARISADDAKAKTAIKPGEARAFSADLDNNGGIDLLISDRTGTRIWLQDAAGAYRALASQLRVVTLSTGDLNSDGRLELVGLDPEGKAVRANNGGKLAYAWIVLRPRAAKVVGDGRINSFGVGGEFQVRAGLLVQTQVIAGPFVHFGLGLQKGADVARVVWPNGTTQAEFATKANDSIHAEQRLKGSCPFVYANDGSGVHFVTDFLWRSPLGLRINAQDTAGVGQTEDWIKIRGDQLVPLKSTGGEDEYDLRITAELWETHYWDHVSLMVVDHPKEIEVFVDERFARKPPTLAVHAMIGLKPVASARDDKGLDVTDRIRSRDGDFLDTFGRGFYQGVTRDHWVEVELGDDLPKDGKLTLIAQGWIHPTDSSINVALGQGTHEPPRGLVLEALKDDGSWGVVRDDIGFPAGKNKTILIDLDGVLRPGKSKKIRLRTNLEIYWDALFIAALNPKAELKTQRLSPSVAELRHRGYSLMTQKDQSSPEIPRYDMLMGEGQRWNDLIGLYTRFGDVAELIEKVDDRYVIANAGDELMLRFPAPPAPPDGWTRDFVLIGDGWNKDGDYNTAFSKTVLPLPSHARPEYDKAPGELEDDPVFRAHPDDWQRFHTRYVSPRVFFQGLGPTPASNP
ncbi:FG-GAP-like repeat-containing protein [Singulisphaera sp. PoT]|uniref:FG-GAP-like repeat-containing protein n=1 Tax=Singulisphaera sp. PoT TaxID=3411797 RepID=UPI003BF4B4EC